MPSESLETPMIRPGRYRLCASLRGEEGGVRAAEAHRHAEPLAVADGDVGAELARGDQQRQREQIGGHGDQRAGGVRRFAELPVIANGAVGGRVLDQRADDALLEREAVGVGHDDLDAPRLGAGLHHGDGLRVALAVHHEGGRALVPGDGDGEVHRLGGGGGLVEEGGVGHRQAREIGHHGLEVEQRLEAALRDLGLVRRIGGVPARILEDVALDHLRGEGPRVAHADIGSEDLVHRRDTAELLEHLALAPAGRQGQRAAEPDVLRDHGVDEVVHRLVADRLQHRVDVCGAGAEVAGDEAFGLDQAGERGSRGRFGSHGVTSSTHIRMHAPVRGERGARSIGALRHRCVTRRCASCRPPPRAASPFPRRQSP